MRKYFKYIIFNLSFLILNSFCFSQNASGEPSRTIDSLKLALKNAKHDTTRCNILSALVETSNEDEWQIYNEQLLKIAEKNVNAKCDPQNFYLVHLSGAYSNMSVMNYEDGNMKGAIDFSQKSLKINEKTNDRAGIARALINLGAIYHQLGDFITAKSHFVKSLKISEEIHNLNLVNGVLNYLGSICINEKNEEKAMEYFQRALNVSQESKDENGMSTALNNIGYLYSKQSNQEKALEYYQRALTIDEKYGQKIKLIPLYINLSRLELKRNQIKKSLVYVSMAMTMAKELKYPEGIMNSAHMFKQIFQKQNKFKEAFEMYELEIKMRDSINNQETQKAAIKKQMQYTYEKKELETKAEQDKKDAIAKAELKQKENERNYFIVGFGLVAVLALFILRGYKQKQKANEIIAAQKHLVDEKQKEILDSIYYAKRIQTTLLPSQKYIDKSLQKLNKI